jgi:hypothetical protein
MKNFRKLITSGLGLMLGSMALVSCVKDSTTQLQAVGDIIIQDTKTDAGVKYGLVVYVTANFEIASGTVTAPGTNGKVYQLTPTANKYQCIYYPKATDYTADMPVSGNYQLQITATSGETLYGQDAVGTEKLDPIVIKTTDISPSVVKITWDAVTNADAYIVRLYDVDKSKVLFSTDYLMTDVKSYNLTSSSSGWASGFSPVAGTNYVIELVGVRVEKDALTDKGSNLQFLTTDSKTVKWQ